MIPLLAVVVATVLACEVALRSPLVRLLGTLTRTSRKAAAVIASRRISDHWKERALPALAWRLMKASVGLLLWLVAVALPVIAAASLALGSLAEGTAYLVRPGPLVLVMVVGIAWIAGRRRLAA